MAPVPDGSLAAFPVLSFTEARKMGDAYIV